MRFNFWRPRTADEVLGQPKDGSSASSSLKSLLLSAKKQRITGVFEVTSGERNCSLYFLFGHLFHAASDTLTGEAAVLDCLTWPDVRYTFDAKAKLPTEETIERPLDQILAA